jgi:sugar lactone lactonase YvrE
MSVTPLEFPAKYSSLKWKLFSSLLLPLICGSSAWAAAPAVVIDTQQILSNGFNSPQSLAVNSTNQGAIFIADTNNNQIVALVNGVQYDFNPPGFTLSAPNAIALDAKGDLFVGDTPSNNGTSVGRVIEMPAVGGNLTGTAQLLFAGAPLTDPISLAVDSAGTVFIGDFAGGNGAIYSLASGATTPTLLSFTGLNPQFVPASLLRDSSNNLYIADNGNDTSTGGIYVAPDTGGNATQVPTPSFAISQASGLALNSSGDLFILSVNSNFLPQVLVVPAASPSTPYIIPSNAIGASSGLALDANANLDVLDFADGEIFQLNYLAPTNLGYLNVGQSGQPVLFNFEFNAPATLSGFRIVTQGDVSTDLTQVSGGTCANGTYNPSPSSPYACIGFYEGTPKFPGIRNTSILVSGPNNTTLASTSAYEIGFAGAEVTYPLTATTTATNLQQPQAVAISGLNNTVYVADTQAGVVYSTSGLAGSTLTPVSTGTTTLQAPSALALDAAGDLFIADFNLGEVIEVPTATGQAPSVVIPAGGLLQHPIALTVDFLGNLYVGDAGPGGLEASTSNPGYIVKLPPGGTAFKMTLPATLPAPVVFPQALTTDFYTGFLFIGDSGEAPGAGQVVVVTADGSVGGPVALSGVTNPTGLGLDPAGALYVLDGTANTITIDPIYSGAPPYLLSFDNTTLGAASAMGMSAGGQSFVIANIASGTTNLVFLNGNSSTLSFGNVTENTQSQPMTATEYNIGNSPLTLASPYYTTATPNSAFNILGSSTCGNNVVLPVGNSCSINVQFAPAFIGSTGQTITVDSNGYNTGTSVLNLQGTGTAGPSVARGKKHRNTEPK